jgi:hypothetical protein
LKLSELIRFNLFMEASKGSRTGMCSHLHEYGSSARSGGCEAGSTSPPGVVVIA